MKTNLKMILLAAAVWALPAVLVVLQTGCESTEASSPIARLAVQYATIKVVQNNPEHAARVVEIATALEKDAGNTVAVTVVLLETIVRSQIRWENLDAADTALVDVLILTVRDELTQRLGTGILGPEQALVVAQVAGWIRDAAMAASKAQLGPATTE